MTPTIDTHEAGLGALPDVLPGHWDTPEGREMAERSLGEPRRYAQLSDLALANAVFMAGRQDLNLIVMQTAAKERIRWLSAHLAQALAALARAPDTTPQARGEGWRPIEEAPRDVEVLGYDGRVMMSVVLDSMGRKDRSGWCMACDEYGFTPTHFMPLPAPPVERGS